MEKMLEIYEIFVFSPLPCNKNLKTLKILTLHLRFNKVGIGKCTNKYLFSLPGFFFYSLPLHRYSVVIRAIYSIIDFFCNFAGYTS